jgi:hypothetical protein
MGRERDCVARIDGKKSEGSALLETDEIVFRGASFRLRFPLRALGALAVNGDSLSFVAGEQRIALELGAAEAAKWLKAIENPKSRIDKLGIKPGQKVAVVAVDDPTLVEELRDKGAEVRRGAPLKNTDVVFFGVKAKKDLARVATLRPKLADKGALWIVRPKGAAAITERAVLSAGKEAGLVDVKVVKLSETSTAQKFVIPVAKRRATSK